MNILAIAAILLQSSAEQRAANGLTTFSWSFMIFSLVAVTLLTTWSFWRILTTKAHFDPDGTGPDRPPVAARTDREEEA